MSAELDALRDLQALDTRIAGLEAEAARLPGQIEAIRGALAEARKAVDTLRARAETTRKDLRARERDLDDLTAKRAKAEGRLWEVKSNVEYSAVLAEIEHIKQEKARLEEDVLGLMELGERLAAEIREAEGCLARREEEARREEAGVREKLAAVEVDLAAVRSERAQRSRDLAPGLLADYERALRALGGLAVVPVTAAGVCGGCRVAIRPQAVQELRHGGLLRCESCGRYLYWQD